MGGFLALPVPAQGAGGAHITLAPDGRAGGRAGRQADRQTGRGQAPKCFCHGQQDHPQPLIPQPPIRWAPCIQRPGSLPQSCRRANRHSVTPDRHHLCLALQVSQNWGGHHPWGAGHPAISPTHAGTDTLPVSMKIG